jgi:aspartate-semialdehyde dehydrogenase
MEQAVDQERLSQALAGDHVTHGRRRRRVAAQQREYRRSGQYSGSLKAEAEQPNGIWIWAAADNLRVAAITAVECAESMIATRPLGKIQ